MGARAEGWVTVRRQATWTMGGTVSAADSGQPGAVALVGARSHAYVVCGIQTRCRRRPPWWKRAVLWYIRQIAAMGAEVAVLGVFRPTRWAESLWDVRVRFLLGGRCMSDVIGPTVEWTPAAPVLVRPGQPLRIEVTNFAPHPYDVSVCLLGYEDVPGELLFERALPPRAAGHLPDVMAQLRAARIRGMD